MSSTPADGDTLRSVPRGLRDCESSQAAQGDSAEAIVMLAEWMMDDLIALAESFRLDPNDLFKEAVAVFAEALEKQDPRQPPVE